MAEEGKGLAKVSMESVVKSQEFVLEFNSGDSADDRSFIKYLTRGPLYADIRSLSRLGIEFWVSRTVTENFKVTVE